MSKRKTRKEKIRSQMRQLFATRVEQPNTFVFASSTLSRSPQKQHTYAIPYLKRDLLKTALVTSAIIGAQLVLFALLKNHSINLPNINY